MDKLTVLLNELEAELRALNLWSDIPPAPEKLASRQPFAVDTLTLPEWLQWIYLQRLRALVDANAPLPSGAGVKPYAEEYFARTDQPTDRLLGIIDRIDDCLGRP